MIKTLHEHLDPAIRPKRILALDGGGIRGAFGKNYSPKKIEELSDMSNAENCEELYSIGEAAGKLEILESHLPDKFNL